MVWRNETTLEVVCFLRILRVLGVLGRESVTNLISSSKGLFIKKETKKKEDRVVALIFLKSDRFLRAFSGLTGPSLRQSLIVKSSCGDEVLDWLQEVASQEAT